MPWSKLGPYSEDKIEPKKLFKFCGIIFQRFFYMQVSAWLVES